MAGRRKIEYSDDELLEAAEMYYIRNQRQDDIAKTLKRTNRQEVSRMLDEARTRGIVRIQIASNVKHTDLHRLEEALKRRFSDTPLRDVILVAGHPTILELRPIDTIREGVALSIAQAAAEYLSKVLRDGDTVAVGRGRMVKSTVNALRVNSMPELRVAPMIGFLSSEYDPFGASAIAADFQRVTQGQCFLLPAPALVPKVAAPVVRKLPLVKATLEILNKSNVVVSSLGAIHHQAGQEAVLEKLGMTDREIQSLILALRGHWPVGEINAGLFYEDGHLLSMDKNLELNLEIDWRTIGIELSELRAATKKEKLRMVCPVGADRKRITAIRAALQGGLISTLITDHITAQAILNPGIRAAGVKD